MRILHELNQLDKGGAERVVEGIIRHDRKNEHTVYAYKDGPMKEILEAAGAKVFVDDNKTTHELQADIVHVHTGGDESKLAKAAEGQLTLVETIHSPVVTRVRDAYVHARVGVSKTVAKLNRKCQVIYNGVDIDRLNASGPDFAYKSKTETADGGVSYQYKTCREYLGIPDDAFVIGRLGRIGFDKCLEEFLITCREAQKNDYQRDIYVLIVGDEAANSLGYIGKLKVMAASLPVKNVQFLPAIEQVGWAYEAMDVFLYPSPGEGFCLVIAEAMACGVPVVTWETPLTNELFAGCAMLAKPNIESLKNHVVYLMLHEAMRSSISAQGHKRVMGDFTSEIMSEKYQSLYSSMEAGKDS